jgi:hypothetical protein
MKRGGTDIRARVETEINFYELINALEHFAENYPVERLSIVDMNRIHRVSDRLGERWLHYHQPAVIVDLTPCITLAINNGRSRVALGFQWICGTVNFGIMTRDYQKAEKERRERIRTEAAKIGITPRQAALRWGW